MAFRRVAWRFETFALAAIAALGLVVAAWRVPALAATPYSVKRVSINAGMDAQIPRAGQ